MQRHPLRRASIAAELRALIAVHKVSKASVAHAADMSVDTLRRRLDGVYPFHVEEVDAICFVLGVPLEEFTKRVREREAAL